MPEFDRSEFMLEFFGKALRSEIGGARAHTISIARRAWRVPAHLRNLPYAIR
jgi:hypothetical protein